MSWRSTCWNVIFAPGLHEEILDAVGLELGTPVATRRRDMAFRAAVLEAYRADGSVWTVRRLAADLGSCRLNQPLYEVN